MAKLINLQNTATPDSVESEAVSFQSAGVTLRGTLYKPARSRWAKILRGGNRLPAAVVTGAWTTVKEQMAGTYAREMAVRGMIALSFDFTGWGESDGDRRYVEDPALKTADIHAAVDFLAQQKGVDAERLFGLGICASSGYMAEAVADHAGLAKLALVAPWLHDLPMAVSIYGGLEGVNELIAASQVAAGSASVPVLTAASTTDDTAPMFQAPYYTEDNRGLINAYDNKFSVLSWKPWLTYNGQVSAKRLTKPVFLVGSAGMALPAGAEAYEQSTGAPLQKLWLADDINQFDFYDRADVVQSSADAVADFFQE